MRIKQSGVYQVINKINDKFYIGSSADINRRWYDHRNSAKKPDHPHRSMIWEAYRKYGIENFTFVIIEECEPIKEVLLAREQHYIDSLKPEYNILPNAGSRLGSKSSEETKVKLRGIKQSQETCEKKRLAHTGKKASPKAVASMVEAQNRPDVLARSRETALNRKHTPESILKMSEVQKSITTDEKRERFRVMAVSRKGTKATPETKTKLKAAKAENNIWIGKKHKPESLLKMADKSRANALANRDEMARRAKVGHEKRRLAKLATVSEIG